jgi:hypothetical protein
MLDEDEAAIGYLEPGADGGMIASNADWVSFFGRIIRTLVGIVLVLVALAISGTARRRSNAERGTEAAAAD